MWGGTGGLSGLARDFQTSTSAYIRRDIAHCCTFALHQAAMRLKGPSIGFNCTERSIVSLMEGRPHVHQASLDERSDSWLDFISYIFAIQHRLIIAPRRRHMFKSLPSLIHLFIYQYLFPLLTLRPSFSASSPKLHPLRHNSRATICLAHVFR
jgi:hypothetical protein